MKTELHHPKVLIVGAGPAGLGVSLALKQAGVFDQLVIDAREIGAAFRSWPKGMKLLSPSFYSNPFGLTDLNAIDPATSPADYLKTQHPEGAAYADYLSAVATQFDIPVSTGIEVTDVIREEDGFEVDTTAGTIRPEYVVWAAGQFFYPRNHDFPGASLALHNSQVSDWGDLKGEVFTVIGGYESGVDAAINLVSRGKKVCLISSGEPWSSKNSDPSRSLSPRTLDRLRDLLDDPERADSLELLSNTTITRIDKVDGYWVIENEEGQKMSSLTQPILANGFHSGLGMVERLFDEDANGLPVFTEEADESTLTPGLFYSGPSLVHRNSLFCFIYKYRARFGVIAAEVAKRLGVEDVQESLASYAEAGFMNTDLDCCTNCECAIEPNDASAPTPDSFTNS